MAKTPNSQTIESYQTNLQNQINNSSDGISKSTNQAILSKTYNDKIIKQLKEKISLEKESLELQKQELQRLKSTNASLNEQNAVKQKIKNHRKEINKLNKEGVSYLDKEVKSIQSITDTYKKQVEYQQASLNKKLEMKQTEAEELKARLQSIELLRKEGKLTSSMQKERVELQRKYEDSRKREQSLQESIVQAEEKQMTYAQKKAAQEERLNNAKEAIKQLKIGRDAVLMDKNSTDEEKGLATRYYNEQYKKVQQSVGSSKYEQAAISFYNKMGSKADTIIAGLNAVNEGLAATRNILNKGVDDAAAIYTKYMGSIDARLYGTNLTFTKMQKDVSNTLGASRYVSQQKMLENLYKLTESGIAFNLEYRAWLETVSDKMVTTFDTLDQSLTRLVRLQQADVSNASLGSEALMTKYLNNLFKDTSYLNNLYDSVAATLLDATSQQSATNSIGYQFSIQKWLGALSSVGMSDSAVTSIAQALNWLGTGNVTELNNNNAASTLLNLSAQRAGLSYSEMLLNGTNADNMNKLMKAMVTYLQDIVTNTKGNQVVKSAWGDILNLSQSDLRAITNLTQKDLTTIYNTKATYSSAIKEVNNQTSYISKRTSAAEQVDNVINNLLFQTGASVASSTSKYLLWKGSGLVDSLSDNLLSDGGITGVAKSILHAITGVTSAIAIFDGLKDSVTNLMSNGLSSVGSNSLNGFKFTLYQSRGQGFTGVAGAEGGKNSSNALTGTSYSSVATTAADTSSSASNNLAANANKVSSSAVSNSATSGRSADDIYSQLFEKKTAVNVKVTGMSSDVISDMASAFKVSKLNKIVTVLTEGNIDVTVTNTSDFQDVFASTASTIQYVQGL